MPSRICNSATSGVLLTAALLLCVAHSVAQSTGTSKSQSVYQGETRRKTRVVESDNALREAETAIEKQDYATAEAGLKKIATEQPQNYRAWFDLGSVYAATKRDDLAIDAFRRSHSIEPRVLETNLNLAVLLAQRGEAESGKYLRNAEKLKPNAQQLDLIGRSWMRLGTVLASKDRANAVDALEQASRLRPKDPAPKLELGSLLESSGDLAGAEKQYLAANAADPDAPDPLAALSNLYMRTKRYDAAEQKLRAFAAAQPNSASVHLQLGRVLAAENKHQDAIAEFEKTLQLEPTNDDALRELANSQVALKQFEPATKTLNALLAKNPNDPSTHAALGNAYLKSQKYEEAQNQFVAALKVQPTNADLLGSLALAASENKQYALAIRALDAKAKMQPESPGTFFLRATCYDHLGAYKEASTAYKQFLEVAGGRFPDEEWKARHRLIAIDPDTKRKQR